MPRLLVLNWRLRVRWHGDARRGLAGQRGYSHTPQKKRTKNIFLGLKNDVEGVAIPNTKKCAKASTVFATICLGNRSGRV
jgi:hypothetical protein